MAFPHAKSGSNVELLDYQNEFTPQQIANFKEAFSVFDVNRDGRISATEIFEVLSSMQNEVTPDRQAKIRAAIIAVDVDGTGDLDFNKFIHFMKIMDEHNKAEAAEVDAGGADLNEEWTWTLACWATRVRRGGERNTVWSWLMWLMFIYNVVHSIGVIVLVGLDADALQLNPSCTTDDPSDGNRYAVLVRFVRAVNAVNVGQILLVLGCIFVRARQMHETLDFLNYTTVIGNVFKFLFRPLFVVNAGASVIYILGLQRNGHHASPSQMASDHWEAALPQAVQIVVTFLMMSPYLYFDRNFAPLVFGGKVKTVLLDLFLLSWPRIVTRLLLNVAAFALLPFSVPFTFVFVAERLLRSSALDPQNPLSFTSRALRIITYVSGAAPPEGGLSKLRAYG